YVPTLCNLQDLTPYGGCRLCIVRVLDSRKPFQTACSTPAVDGMKVITKDKELQEMRREVLQLILSEHPNGCLVCAHKNLCEDLKADDKSKSGRVFGCFSCSNKDVCELRNVVEYLEIDEVAYEFEYKNLPLEREDPFFDRDYNLCILCGRCVRTCEERGISAINFMHRGHETKISTGGDVPHIDSNCIFCGSCVDVCPTGALTSKNTKWVKKGDNQTKSVCNFCSVQCGFNYYTIDEELMESIPSKQDRVNKGKGCVLGRFCTPAFVNHPSRLKHPMIRKEKTLVPARWEDVYTTISEKLSEYKPEEIGFVISPDLTNESAYLFQKFAEKVIKTPNIALSTNFIPIIGQKDQSFDTIPDSKWILLLNTNIQLTHPVLLVRLKQAKDRGAKIVSLNIGDIILPDESRNLFDIELNLSIQDATSILLAMLGAQNKLLLRDLGLKMDEKVLEKYKLAQFVDKRRYQKGTVLMGNFVKLPSSYLNNLQKLILTLASQGESKISCIGLWDRGNLNGVTKFVKKPFSEIEPKLKSGEIKVLYTTERIAEVDPDKVEFLIVQDIFQSEFSDKADVILPAACFTEQTGHTTNAEYYVRKLKESAASKGSSKPDPLILKELCENEKAEEDFVFYNPNEISEEIFHIETEDSSKNLDFKDILKISVEEKYPHFTLHDFQFRGQLIANLVPDFQLLVDTKEGTQEEEPKKQEEEITDFKVVHIEENVPNVFKLVVHAPLLAKKARPGNFVLVMTKETSERVPITLSDWDPEKGTVTFFFQERGFSTKELSEVKIGGYLHSMVGPLGNAIEIKKDQTILLGGGCYGPGALYPVAKAAKALGNKVVVIMEGKSSDILYLRDEYEKLVDDIIYVTADGSHGYKGSEHGKITTGIEVVTQTEKFDEI
ncbi:MAG: molybdopterin-dependent oxidoreductase, partial [Promethearchaeota archaeon]